MAGVVRAAVIIPKAVLILLALICLATYMLLQGVRIVKLRCFGELESISALVRLTPQDLVTQMDVQQRLGVVAVSSLRLRCLAQADVPKHEPEPVANDSPPLLVLPHRELLVPLPQVNELLDADQWPIALQLHGVALCLTEPALQHELFDFNRVDVESQLLNIDADLVFVGVNLRVVVVAEAEVHLISERLDQILALNANFPVENVLHHFKNNVGAHRLKYAVLQVRRLVPNRCGNEHLTLAVPVYTDISDLLQLYDSRIIPKQVNLFGYLLYLLLFFFCHIRVKSDVPDCQPERDGPLHLHKVVVLEADVNVLDVVLDAAEQLDHQAE